MTPYPTDFLEPAKLIIEIVRAGQIDTRRTEFAHALWNVQGVVMSWTIGEPVPLPQGLNANSDHLRGGCCKELVEALESTIEEEGLPQGFNPFLIIQIVKLILDLLSAKKNG